MHTQDTIIFYDDFNPCNYDHCEFFNRTINYLSSKVPIYYIGVICTAGNEWNKLSILNRRIQTVLNNVRSQVPNAGLFQFNRLANLETFILDVVNDDNSIFEETPLPEIMTEEEYELIYEFKRVPFYLVMRYLAYTMSSEKFIVSLMDYQFREILDTNGYSKIEDLITNYRIKFLVFKTNKYSSDDLFTEKEKGLISLSPQDQVIKLKVDREEASKLFNRYTTLKVVDEETDRLFDSIKKDLKKYTRIM